MLAMSTNFQRRRGSRRSLALLAGCLLSVLARASIAQPLASWDDGSAKQAIIAVLGEGPITGKTDGMVAYESAHIEGVESEKIVRSGHSTQGHP